MGLELGNPITPPPKKPPTQTAGRSSRADEKARGARVEERAEGLTGLFQIACIPLLATGNLADMGAVTTHGPTISREAALLAESNSKVADAIDKVIAVGPFAGLVASTVPLILQILVNHGRLPAHGLAQFGVYPPELMQQRAAIDVMKQQAEAQRAEAEALAEMQAAQEELQRVQARNGSGPASDE